MTPIQRIEARIEPIPEAGCFIYMGYIGAQGYGVISVNNYPNYVHRVVYEYYKGKVPKSLQIDHKCRVRSCCNPDHLEAVTHKEDGLREQSIFAKNARKTHCPQGHPYSEENTRLERNWQGNISRKCRICARWRGH